MGSRGPRPDPTSARSHTGRNTSSQTARVSLSPVPMPEHVATSALASKFWADHQETLTASGRLRPELAETFALLCHWYADCRALADQIAAEGWITSTDKGQAASPVAKLLRDSRRDFVCLAKEFGLTAASDSRLPQDPTDGKEDDDEEAALLQKLKVRSL